MAQIAEKIEYITDANGNKISVVIPVKKYEEILEDINDLLAFAERQNEPTISFEQLKKSLNILFFKSRCEE